MTALCAPSQVYVNSATMTAFTASVNVLYVIDTAAAGVTVTLPAGVAIGNVIILQNAPANGPQVGGSTAGNTVTILPTGSETMEGDTSETLSPPTSTVTAATRRYWPVGSASATSGFGAGWVH